MFALPSITGHKACRPRALRRPRFETLETRQLMTASAIDIAGNLVIQGTAGNDVVQISEVQSGNVKWFRVEANGASEWHAASLVKTGVAVFNGGNGNDYFRNNAPTLNVVAFGGDGDDILIGGAGNDQLIGGAGHDQLFGQAGNDLLWGEAGSDVLVGGAGNDQLMGGDGNDQLFGEAGNDRLFGDAGNDLLVGGAGSDFFHGGVGITTNADFDSTADTLAPTGFQTAVWRGGRWFAF